LSGDSVPIPQNLSDVRYKKRHASYLPKTVGMQRGLKSPDSLQLASALAASEHPELFIAADNLLGEIAELQGLDVMLGWKLLIR